MRMNLEGLIPIAIGLWAYGMAFGYINASKDAVKNEEWRKRNMRLLKIAAPIAIGIGVLMLCGVMN